MYLTITKLSDCVFQQMQLSLFYWSFWPMHVHCSVQWFCFVESTAIVWQPYEWTGWWMWFPFKIFVTGSRLNQIHSPSVWQFKLSWCLEIVIWKESNKFGTWTKMKYNKWLLSKCMNVYASLTITSFYLLYWQSEWMVLLSVLLLVRALSRLLRRTNHCWSYDNVALIRNVDWNEIEVCHRTNKIQNSIYSYFHLVTEWSRFQ